MTINALDATLLNWYSLTDIERASPIEIDEMVSASEEILSQEKFAWMSQKEEKASEDSNKGKNDESKKDR